MFAQQSSTEWGLLSVSDFIAGSTGLEASGTATEVLAAELAATRPFKRIDRLLSEVEPNLLGDGIADRDILVSALKEDCFDNVSELEKLFAERTEQLRLALSSASALKKDLVISVPVQQQAMKELPSMMRILIEMAQALYTINKDDAAALLNSLEEYVNDICTVPMEAPIITVSDTATINNFLSCIIKLYPTLRTQTLGQQARIAMLSGHLSEVLKFVVQNNLHRKSKDEELEKLFFKFPHAPQRIKFATLKLEHVLRSCILDGTEVSGCFQAEEVIYIASSKSLYAFEAKGLLRSRLSSLSIRKVPVQLSAFAVINSGILSVKTKQGIARGKLVLFASLFDSASLSLVREKDFTIPFETGAFRKVLALTCTAHNVCILVAVEKGFHANGHSTEAVVIPISKLMDASSQKTFGADFFVVTLLRRTRTKKTGKRLLLAKNSLKKLGHFSLKSKVFPFCVEMWVLPISVGEQNVFFSHGDKDTEEFVMELSVCDAGVVWRAGCRTPQFGYSCVSIEVSEQKLIERHWAHIACNFTGQSWELLLNGERRATAPAKVLQTPIHHTYCSIGKSFTGFVAEVRVWNHTRSVIELKRDCKRQLSGEEMGLLAYFPLDEGEGQIITDCSSCAAHGYMPVGIQNSTPENLWLPCDNIPPCGQTETNIFEIMPSLLLKDSSEPLVFGAGSQLIALAIRREPGVLFVGEYNLKDGYCVADTALTLPTGATPVSLIYDEKQDTLMLVCTTRADMQRISFYPVRAATRVFDASPSNLRGQRLVEAVLKHTSDRASQWLHQFPRIGTVSQKEENISALVLDPSSATFRLLVEMTVDSESLPSIQESSAILLCANSRSARMNGMSQTLLDVIGPRWEEWSLINDIDKKGVNELKGALIHYIFSAINSFSPSTGKMLLFELVDFFLTETALLQLLLHHSGKARNVGEDALYMAAISYFSHLDKIDQLLHHSEAQQISSSLILEAQHYFTVILQKESTKTGRQFDGHLTMRALEVWQEMLFANISQREDEDMMPLAAQYTGTLLKACESSIQQSLAAVRKGKRSSSQVSSLMSKTAVGMLAPSLIVAIPLLPTTMLLEITEKIYSLRDALRSFVESIRGGAGPDELALRVMSHSLTFLCCRVACGMVESKDVLVPSDVETFHKKLFRGGLQRVGSSRDAVIKSLIQGVGTVSRVFEDLQRVHSSIGFTPGSRLCDLEREVFAGFCNAILPTETLINAKRENFEAVFTAVRSLRTWILSKRQEDPAMLDVLEEKAKMLCRFEPCSVAALSVVDFTKKMPARSKDSRREWKKMFNAWKAMRKLRAMIAVLKNDEVLETEITSVLTSFFQSETVDPQSISASIALRTTKGNLRLAGFVMIRKLLEECLAENTQSGTIQSLLSKTFTGSHYLSDLEGCSSEVAVRIRGVYFQIVSDVLRALQQTKARFWAELVLAFVSMLWQVGDFSSLQGFNVGQILLHLADISGGGNCGLSFPCNHNIPIAFCETKLAADFCSPSLTVSPSGLCARGSDTRGCCLANRSWSTKDSIPYLYCEMTIIEMSSGGSVSIGINPDTVNVAIPSGWDLNAAALHSEDGALFSGNNNGRQVCPPFGTGDTVGCGIDKAKGELFWTRNGKLVHGSVEATGDNFHLLVGIDGPCVVQLNFGLRPFVFDLPQVGKPYRRPLRQRAWDTFCLYTLFAASANKGKETGLTCPPTQSLDQCISALAAEIHVCRSLSNSSSDFQSQRLCTFCVILFRSLHSRSITSLPRLAQELICLCCVTTSPQLRLLSIQALGAATCLLFPSELNEQVSIALAKAGHFSKETFLSFLFLIARQCFVVNQPSFLGEQNLSQVFSDLSSWQAFALLGELNSLTSDSACVQEVRDEWRSTTHNFILSMLTSPRVPTQLVALAILAGHPTPPLPGDKVEICDISTLHSSSLRASSDSNTLISYDILEGVAEILVANKHRLQVSVNNVEISRPETFPCCTDIMHRTQCEKLISFATSLWGNAPGTTPKSTFEKNFMSVALLRIFLRCADREVLSLSSLAPLLAELCGISGSSGSHHEHELSEWVAASTISLLPRVVVVESPPQRNIIVPETPTTKQIDSVETISEDARTRLAQELSMRGFGLDLCMIALEETQYDRAAALRLLSDHHDELYQALQTDQNEEENENAMEEEMMDSETEDAEESATTCPSDSFDGSQKSIASDSDEGCEGICFQRGSIRITSQVALGPQFTLDLWIRPQSLHTSQVLMCQTGVNSVLSLKLIDGKVLFGWSSFGTLCEMTLNESDAARWTRITGVQDCDDLLLYKNGVLRDTCVASWTEGLLSAEVVVGSYFDGSQPYIGDMKNIRFYDTALAQEAVEGLFSVSQTPNAASGSNSHLAIHFKCDDGQFPLTNCAVSNSAVSIAVTMNGQIDWVDRTSREGVDEKLVTQPEVDFSTQNDIEGLLEVRAKGTGRNLLSKWKHFKDIGFNSLFTSLAAISGELQKYYSCQLLLKLLAKWPPTLQLSFAQFSTTECISTIIRQVAHSRSPDLQSLLEAVIERVVPQAEGFSDVLSVVTDELLDLISVSPTVSVFESTHPCKSFAETPKEINRPGQSYYEVFFDQRTNVANTHITFYSNPALTHVLTRATGPSISAFRIHEQSFFFDVRIDTPGPQWGYKMNVVYDSFKQLSAAKILRLLVIKASEAPKPLRNMLYRKDFCTKMLLGACKNVGACRRILFSALTSLLSIPLAFVEFGSTHALSSAVLYEMRRMTEKQFRKEMGLNVHSHFLQVMGEFFVVLKDAEVCWTAIQQQSSPLNSAAQSDYAHFASKRQEQKSMYSNKMRDGKERVTLEKTRFPESLRVEQNVDKSIASWSEYSGASIAANVTLYGGKWYFEVKIVSPGDVVVGVVSTKFDTSIGSLCHSPDAWGYNGRTELIYSNGLPQKQRFSDHKHRWKAKDVVGVILDIEEKEMSFFINGCFSNIVIPFVSDELGDIADVAASAIGYSSERETSRANAQENDRSVGFVPSIQLAADEGVVVNFGGTHFEFDVPWGCLPLDPSNLSLGTLIPFNQMRAFCDVGCCLQMNEKMPPFFVEDADPFDNPAHRQGSPHVSIIAEEGIVVSLLEVRNTGRFFSTATANCTVLGGRWYYEVTLMTQGLMQIGWIDEKHISTPDAGIGVGDSTNSWSIDLFRRVKWTDNRNVPLLATRRWTVGDVIGCAVDVDEGKLYFSLNGKPITDILGNEVLFSIPIGCRLAPAVSLRSGNSCVFNFGSSPLRHKPDGFCALGVSDTWNERIDTFYATLSSESASNRVKRIREVQLAKQLPPLTIVKLIGAVNHICEETAKTVHQVTVAQIREVLQQNSGDVVVPSLEVLEADLEILKSFGRLSQQVLPMIPLETHCKTLLAPLLLTFRLLLFRATRESLAAKLLRETSVRGEHARLTIHRLRAKSMSEDDYNIHNTVFGQTHRLLAEQGARMFKTTQRFWSVVFAGEGAEDVGGPFREHMTEMCSELMSPNKILPLFVLSANNVHNVGEYREGRMPSPSATSAMHLSMFRLVGRIMGGALRSGEPLSLFFPPIVWKFMTRHPIIERDLGDFDQLCLQCVNEFCEMQLHGEAAEEMFNDAFSTETFTTILSDGSVKELIPNGSSVRVTFDRCGEYAKAIVQARLNESKLQLEAMREGLISVVPEVVLLLFQPDELEVRVCGKPDYTIDELKASATYEGLTSDDRRVGFLWKALESATPLQRRLFLRFVSGRERMPVKLRILPMTAQGDPNGALPRAATCFFALELPDYSSVEILKEKLFFTIANCVEIDTDFYARDVDDHDRPHIVTGIDDGHGEEETIDEDVF